MAIEKIKILGAVLELPAKQHCQFSPFCPISEVNGLDWQCYLAGSSRTAPRIWIFSIAIGADYSIDIKSGFSIAPAFSLHKNFDVSSESTNRCSCIGICGLGRMGSVITDDTIEPMAYAVCNTDGADGLSWREVEACEVSKNKSKDLQLYHLVLVKIKSLGLKCYLKNIHYCHFKQSVKIFIG